MLYQGIHLNETKWKNDDPTLELNVDLPDERPATKTTASKQTSKCKLVSWLTECFTEKHIHGLET